jgi:uncharacterized protein
MIIIHGMNRILDRLLFPRLKAGLQASPVVVLTGARQTGKSTLARRAPPESRRYFSLDDFDVRAQAERSPDDLLARATVMTLDEVQRVPELLTAVKRSVDASRIPGRFLLTGSANLLLMHQVSESLAGRAIYFTLMPFTRRERLGMGRCGLWSELFSVGDQEWPGIISSQDVPREDWKELVGIGGYPVPATQMPDAEGRELWFSGYTQTYLERDLQELSTIDNLIDFRRLMAVASLRIGQVLNQSGLGRDVGLPQPTVHRYLNLLETSFQLVRIPAYSVNRTKRLIKSPKLYWTDVGLALYLSGEAAPGGQHLENLIVSDILAWRGGLPRRADLLYWRTTTGQEVDLVIEYDGTLLPIEIKSSKRVGYADTANLRLFRSEYPDQTRAGIILYDGDEIEWLSSGILAAPWWRVL